MKIEDARQIPIKECGERLEVLSGDEFVCEPVYFRRGLSSDARIRLRSGVVARLRRAQRHLPQGWNFKIWDGMRTLDTQRQLFEEICGQLSRGHRDWTTQQVHDAAVVFITPPSADPCTVPPHTSGGAVDLTLVDADGSEVAMGTPFDDFTPRAHIDSLREIDEEMHRHRLLLKQALEEEGFTNYPDEWWHYDYGNQLWAINLQKPYAFYGSAERIESQGKNQAQEV